MIFGDNFVRKLETTLDTAQNNLRKSQVINNCVFNKSSKTENRDTAPGDLVFIDPESSTYKNNFVINALGP